MQVLIPIHRVNTENIFFTEKRRNVILDGNFVKILYSTEHFEMNGLHMSMRIDSSSTTSGNGFIRAFEQTPAFSEKPTKYVEIFDPNVGENAKQIEILCKMERDIINHYVAIHSPRKNAVYNLKSQLLSGTFRFSCEGPPICQSDSRDRCLSVLGEDTSAPRHAPEISPLLRENPRNLLADSARPDFFTNPASGSIRNYALKISGIWETNFNVGITVKFIYI